MNDCTIHITYDSSVETTFYNIRRPTLFDLLEVFLGWFQLFTMFLSYVFFFVNSFNIKLQYCQFLFNHVDIQRAKVSILFFIRLVIVYALDFVKCKTCLQALKKKGYLRQEIVCFAAFEELDDELSI